MALVKKQNDQFVESYEVNGFNVDLDQKLLIVKMSKYVFKDNGLPTASDFSYEIIDKLENQPVKKLSQVKKIKRDKDGAIMMDQQGNPILEESLEEIEELEETEIKAFSEIVSLKTSGESLYKEIQKAIYDSFQKYHLKDESFIIE